MASPADSSWSLLPAWTPKNPLPSIRAKLPIWHEIAQYLHRMYQATTVHAERDLHQHYFDTLVHIRDLNNASVDDPEMKKKYKKWLKNEFKGQYTRACL